MRDAAAPHLHVFVCANRRASSPLGPGCGDRGDELYDALKREVAARGEIASTWITKTHCLGICPQHGATVARFPAIAGRAAVQTEATPQDVEALLSQPSTTAGAPSKETATAPADGLPELMHELALLEELQRGKVLALARRLKPGLTMEDVQNPHDFPELDDPDWHYADGVLAGIASVKTAALALSRRTRSEGNEP